jgi:hypothetical protein
VLIMCLKTNDGIDWLGVDATIYVQWRSRPSEGDAAARACPFPNYTD